MIPHSAYIHLAHEEWCQDPFQDTPEKGNIEPSTCPIKDGKPARYCRKIDQQGKKSLNSSSIARYQNDLKYSILNKM